MKVVGHRFANDINKLRSARSMGLRTVEGDLFFCRGGAIMVHPEDFPKRTAEGHLDYSVEEIRAVLAEKGVDMPTLEEALTLIRELGLHLFLESKITGSFATVADVLDGYRDCLTLISKMAPEIRWGAEQGFSVGRLYLGEPLPEELALMKQLMHIKLFLPNAYYVNATMLEEARRLNVDVVAAVANDLALVERLAAAGVPAVMSDVPELLIKAGHEPG